MKGNEGVPNTAERTPQEGHVALEESERRKDIGSIAPWISHQGVLKTQRS